MTPAGAEPVAGTVSGRPAMTGARGLGTVGNGVNIGTTAPLASAPAASSAGVSAARCPAARGAIGAGAGISRWASAAR